MNITVRFTGPKITGSGEVESRTATGLSPQFNKGQQSAGQDKLTISKQALNLQNRNQAKNSILTSLMEQKQQLMERKAAYFSNAVEKGVSPDVMKLQLDEMDMQMKELNAQIHKLQAEEQRKATGRQEEKPESADKGAANSDESELYPGETAHSQSSKKMSALISAGTELKQTDSIKAAQLTLYSEAKAWEHSQPERSAEMLRKAEALDGKLLETAGSIKDKLADAVEQDEKAGGVRGEAGSRNETVKENSGETSGPEYDPSRKSKTNDTNDPRADKEDEAASGDRS